MQWAQSDQNHWLEYHTAVSVISKPLVGLSYSGLSQIKLLVGVSYSGISHIKTIIWSIILRSQSETNHWLEYHTEVSIDQNHTAVSVRSKPLVGVSNSYSGRSLSGNILLLTTTTRWPTDIANFWEFAIKFAFDLTHVLFRAASGESSWGLLGQRWVKLNAVLDNAESS